MTIVCLTLHPGDPEKTNSLDFPSLRKVYLWMSQDISAQIPSQATAEEKNIARHRCLIGQPVKITPKVAVLRIALGAATACKMVENFAGEAVQDEIVLQKLSVIGKYYYFLCESYDENTC